MKWVEKEPSTEVEDTIAKINEMISNVKQNGEREQCLKELQSFIVNTIRDTQKFLLNEKILKRKTKV